MYNFISLARDRDSGRVYLDPEDGRPRIAYTTSAFDRANILVGIVALAKLCYIQCVISDFIHFPVCQKLGSHMPVPDPIGLLL